MKQWSGSTLIWSPPSLFNVARLFFNWSSNTSAIAVRTTFLSAWIAWLAAPVPRPPQPISPTRNVSVAAGDLWERLTFAVNTDPSAAAVEVFKNSCREGEREIGSLITLLELWFMAKG